MRPRPLPTTPVPTAEGYDAWSPIYDSEGNPLIALEERTLPAHVPDLTDRDVLDVGCGTGRWTVRLVDAGARVTAVDFSSGMVARASNKPGWNAVRFVEHDLTRPLPFGDDAFDHVFCCLVLDHIEPLATLFAEWRRVLRPRGHALVSVMHPAMLLRGNQAHFTDPETGTDVHPRSAPNTVANYVTAAVASGLTIEHISEHAPDAELAAAFPRAEKYIGWPMLLVLRLTPPA